MSQTTIGVISIEQDANFFAGRYFREILTVASQEIVGHDYYLRIVACTPAQVQSPAAIQALIESQQIAAALLIAPNPAFLAANSALFHALPSVIISTPQLHTTLNYVNSDQYSALRQVVAHLAQLGHRRIRLLQPTGEGGDFPERARGYTDAIAALSLEPEIVTVGYPISEHEMNQRVLADLPDALIATDDLDALALLSRLQRRGLRVPEHMALVGFDDEDFAADTFPALTTICQPLNQMARCAIHYLIDRLAGVERGLYQEVLPNRLIVRESCGARQL